MRKQRQSALLAFIDVDYSKFDSAETSSDESFKIENHKGDSDVGSSDESSSESDSEASDEKSSDDEPEPNKIKASEVNLSGQAGTSSQLTTEKLIEHTKAHSHATAKLLSTPVCCACLGDRSDDLNEIVECDGCKITVHEGCYGVSESASISSTASSCSTEPWFCEACKANVKDPDCELCPNRGGIFKETDCGKWVHLVCALYVPGVAFGEVDQLSMVTLFEMQYNKWGAKLCSLCDDERFARTGVCIGCDAGMCKSYFHVTCAQKAGFLSEAHHEEVEQADPFYAHCKSHSQKDLIKQRKRNYNALLVQMKRHEAEIELNKNEKPTPGQERIERKLKKHRTKYTTNKAIRVEPWVPTQKMPRLLSTSASASKKLMKKAELIGVDAAALEFQEAQIASLTDIRKKWHIPPAFSTEFVGYYLDRSIRVNEMKTNLAKQVELNKTLLTQQQLLRAKYDEAIKTNQEVQQRQKDLIADIEEIHTKILKICPNKLLYDITAIGKSSQVVAPTTATRAVASPALSSTPPPQMITNRTMMVPTAAALKMGVGFPLRNDDTGRILSTQCVTNDELQNECGICKKCTEQHLLVKCDTCHLYYHLGCLNPPLTRHPKRSKQYAWQCSECDKSDDSGPENKIIPKGPRRSRVRYSKDGPIFPDPLRDSFGSEKSMKSDESHHRAVNGSEVEPEVKVVKATPTPKVSDDEPELVIDDSVPTTSTPTTLPTEKIQPKKRGRKPKPKPGLASGDSSSAIEMSSQESSPPDRTTTPATAPPKETPNGNHVKTPKPKPVITSAKADLLVASPYLEITKSSSETPKVPKKGRPRKEKPSIAQISNELQKKQEISQQQESKPEVVVLDRSLKTECPLGQYRTFADSIPYPAPTAEFQKLTDESEPIPLITQTQTQPDPTIMPILNGAFLNGEGTTSSGSGHHKHKKTKKNKRRHSLSPSSGDRVPSAKKHKHKKKYRHDLEEPSALDLSASDSRLPEQPRIKMKFCATFVQAGDDKKKMWSLPDPSEEVTVSSRQTFEGFHSSSASHESLTSPIGNGHVVSAKKRKKPLSPKKKARLLLNLSPVKGISSPVIAPSHFINTPITSTPSSASISATTLNASLSVPTLGCDVCVSPGTVQNLVKCDECQKNYHFTCLIPPLKKTPKKRGYSWHCADCDPTDRENN